MGGKTLNDHAISEQWVTTRLNIDQKNVLSKISWTLFTGSLWITDTVMLFLAFRLAYFVRFELALPFFKLAVIPAFSYYQRIQLIFIPVFLILFAARGLYNPKNLLGGTQEYAKIFNAIAIGMLLVITLSFLIPEFIFSRGWLLSAWTFTLFLSLLGRFALRRVVYFFRHYGLFLSNAILVGANDEGILLAQQLDQWRTSGFRLLGFLDNKSAVGQPVYMNLSCIGRVTQLDEIVKQYQVEEIILAASAFSSRDNMFDIFKRYGVQSGVNVRFSSGLYEIITTDLTVQNFAYVPLVGINPVRLTGIDKVSKLILDYTAVSLLLLFSFPIMAIIAIAIKLRLPRSDHPPETGAWRQWQAI